MALLNFQVGKHLSIFLIQLLHSAKSLDLNQMKHNATPFNIIINFYIIFFNIMVHEVDLY